MKLPHHKPHLQSQSIAIVGCDPAAPGGISRVIRLTLDSPLASRWKLLPVSTWVEGSTGYRAMVFLSALKRVWALSALGRLQAVHLHMAARGSFWRKWALSMPLSTLGVRVIVHIHDGSLTDWIDTRSRFTRNRLRRLLEDADAVVALSPFWMNALEPLAPGARWAVVGNPVEMPDESPAARAGAPIQGGAPGDVRASGGKVILFLGRLRPEKGLNEILSAALAMKPHRPADGWLLAGDGDLPAIERRLDEWGLSSSVHLLGWMDERQKRQALAAADLLVLPSHAEGQPLAVLEAMACGVPVVASDVGDIPDLLACGAGLVIPKGDVHALVHAVERILDSPELARQMGQRGRRYVQQHHSLERITCELESLYLGLGLSGWNESRHGPARRGV